MTPALLLRTPPTLRGDTAGQMEGGSVSPPDTAPTPPSIPPSELRALLIARHFLTLELFGRGSICCPITEEAVEREMRFWANERIWEVS